MANCRFWMHALAGVAHGEGEAGHRRLASTEGQLPATHTSETPQTRRRQSGRRIDGHSIP